MTWCEQSAACTAVWSARGDLLLGFSVTLKLTAAAFTLTIVLAVLVAIARQSGSRIARILGTGYVEVFRSLPLLVVMITLYFGLGKQIAQLSIPTFMIAVIAIALYESGFLAEYYRAAIESVRPAQWDAGTSVGLTHGQTMRFVILPQALLPGLPPTFNALVYTIKGSSLASLIAVQEVLSVANQQIQITFQVFAIFFAVASLYLVVTVPFVYLGRWSERKVAAAFGSRPTA